MMPACIQSMRPRRAISASQGKKLAQMDASYKWTIFAMLALLIGCASAEVVNTQVRRKIDLSTQVAKIVTTYTVDGVRGNYNFALPRKDDDRIAFLVVAVSGTDVPFTKEADSPEHEDLVLYSAEVGNLSNGATITVETVYTDVLVPFPKEITQLQTQAVMYTSSLLVGSPYKTRKQTTVLRLASTQIFSMTDVPGKRSSTGSSVTYGPFTDAGPLDAGGELKVHYTNNSPFAKVSSALREIEVSNWGNIAVEEHYDLVHAGAKLKGGFSRLDFASNAGKSSPSFRKLDATLPVGARDIYYRDNIGNISTSTVKYSMDGVELSLLSRFPMFGGWKTSWYQGYNLPTEVGLRHAGSHFILELPFGSPFNAMWVEDLTVKVILPEGAYNVVAMPPCEGVSEERTSRFTFLDIAGNGRPVVILNMKNVVKEHNVMLKVTYDFNRARMLIEPLLLAGFFLGCFLIFMLIGRVDMRIRKNGRVKISG